MFILIRKQVLVLLLLFFGSVSLSIPLEAQSSVDCGQLLQGEFTGDRETNEYRISLNEGVTLYLVGQTDELDKNVLDLDLQIYASNGRQLIDPWYADLVYAVITIPSQGVFSILATGYGEYGGRYTISIACVDTMGIATTNSRYVQNAECGSIIENEYLSDRETHYYILNVQRNDIITANGVVLRGYEDALDVDVQLYASNGRQLDDPWYGDDVVASATAVETGTHTILTQGYGNFGGRYTLYIRCELSNGTIIEPGDAPPTLTLNEPIVQDDFGGFGFPGLSPRDFSAGIQIPLALGQPQTAPIGNDVALYTYNASANETATLRLSRVSGNISIGVAVIKLDTNELLFLSGLPSSNNLTVELTFPSGGMYVVGLFRLDTAERSGTSGAVQLVIG